MLAKVSAGLMMHLRNKVSYDLLPKELHTSHRHSKAL